MSPQLSMLRSQPPEQDNATAGAGRHEAGGKKQQDRGILLRIARSHRVLVMIPPASRGRHHRGQALLPSKP